MELKKMGWKIVINNDFSFTKISFNGKKIIESIKMDNINKKSLKPNTKYLLEKNKYMAMNNILKNEKEIIQDDFNFRNKLIWKRTSISQYDTGSASLKRAIEIDKNGILLQFIYKINYDAYNIYSMDIVLNESFKSFYKLNKEKKIYRKEKIDSRKVIDMDNKWPILIKSGKEEYIINSSMKQINISKNNLVFTPQDFGRPKDIVKAWRVRGRTQYQINFYIQKKNKNWNIS